MTPGDAAPPAAGAARRRWDRHHAAALALLALFALLYLHRIDGWLINDDEEGYLYAAWRISQGELPYRDFLTPQLPAFLFPGALIVKLAGRDPWAMRAWSTALVLVAAAATYLIGRRLFGGLAGLAALVMLLAEEEVFGIGRAFRPEATMLALGTLALYVFVRADADRHRSGYAAAGVLFGGALLAKLFGLLPWAATAAYVGWGAVRGDRPWRRAAGDLAALGLPGAVLVGAVMGAFWWLTPYTYTAVVGHHLMQGQALTLGDVLRKNLGFYWQTLGNFTAFWLFVPLGLLGIRRLCPDRGRVVAWQLPTLLAFAFLSRQLWARHLVYLMPTLALVVGVAVQALTRALRGDRALAALLGPTVVAVMAVPSLMNDVEALPEHEVGTARLALMVRALTPPGARILGDFPGMGFYAERRTTYSGAGISEGAAESGQITGARLLDEMAAGDVALVLIDASSQNGQMTDLVDYDAFVTALGRDYDALGHFYRHYQRQVVYVRRDVPRPAVGFGWATLVAVDKGPGTVEAGGTLPLTAVFQTHARPAGRYTMFLHLVGPDGTQWGGGDRALDNAISRYTEEWEAGEVVASTLTLAVEPGTPPGRYRLRLGLYDATTGTRLPWTAPDQGAGDAWDAGEVEVRGPARPPDVDAPAFRASFAGPDVAWLDAPIGAYRLLAVRRPARATAGDAVAVRLTWRASEAPAGDDRVRLRLTRPDGGRIGDRVLPLGGPDFPTSRWRPGEVVALRAVIVVDPDAPAGAARLSVAVESADGSATGPGVDVGTLEVAALPPPRTAVPAMARAVDARFGPDLALLGADLPPAARPGESITVTLHWRAQRSVQTAYTVLVHLVPRAPAAPGDATAGAAPVAQGDGPPGEGARPTTSWRSGEVVSDAHRIALPADLASGDYALLAGLYDASAPGYPRLPAAVGGRPAVDGRVEVGQVTVGE
ncbi:hypothetical protein DCC79_05235 [bacterium]|nr:MAG: hypothetical protein DCC79_05235 [bacterium]